MANSGKQYQYSLFLKNNCLGVVAFDDEDERLHNKNNDETPVIRWPERTLRKTGMVL